MKYIIYLSAILVALSGCKGNAFMKQRYTSFSNTQQKKENKTTPAKSEVQHQQVAAVVISSSDETTNTNSYQTPNKQLATPPVITENAVSQRTPIAHKNSITEKRGIEKYTSQAGQHFKKINKNEEKRGVIGLILEIILSIVILAIIVAVVILVVLV